MAFDTVDWASMDSILEARGFGCLWCKWILGSVSSANFSIIINGHLRGKIHATRGRGIRQGDPLSPFLFNIIIDSLSRMLSQAELNGMIQGFGLGKDGLPINYLQFADDMLLFSTIDSDYIKNLFDVIGILSLALDYPSITRNRKFWV